MATAPPPRTYTFRRKDGERCTYTMPTWKPTEAQINFALALPYTEPVWVSIDDGPEVEGWVLGVTMSGGATTDFLKIDWHRPELLYRRGPFA